MIKTRASIVGVIVLLAGCGGNTVTGSVSLDYDRNFGVRDKHFRMALMIYTADGERITDFFDGIPVVDSTESHALGQGNMRLKVAPMSPSTIQGSEIPRAFARMFPGHVERELELTFKEFTGTTYRLENVPKGTAFVWFQSNFDGRRTTQIPVIMEYDPTPGEATHQDIRADHNAFYYL